MYLQSKRYTEAIAQYKTALKLIPNQSPLYADTYFLGLATAYALAGRR